MNPAFRALVAPFVAAYLVGVYLFCGVLDAWEWWWDLIAKVRE